MLDRILRRPEVEKCTGLKRSSIYAKVADGTKPVPLGSKAIGWLASEIEEWQKKAIARRSEGH